jgi:hypothetical protein
LELVKGVLVQTVNIEKLRAKVQLGQSLKENSNWDDYCLEVKAFSDSELLLSKPIEAEVVDTITDIIVSFRVAGQWKSYKVKSFKAIHDEKKFIKIDCIEFSLDEGDYSSYRRDFRVARR